MQFKKIASVLISMITIMAEGYLLFNVAVLLFAWIVNTTMQISGQAENETPRILSRLLGYSATRWFYSHHWSDGYLAVLAYFYKKKLPWMYWLPSSTWLSLGSLSS